MADVRVSQLPTLTIANGNSLVASGPSNPLLGTNPVTFRVLVSNVNSANTVVTRNGSGNSGFNGITCNTLNGGSAVFTGDVTAARFFGDGSNLTNLPVPNVDGVPVGTVILYAGLFSPNKYTICDGRAISRSTFQALYNIIGTYFGTGDGSTTFNLPDFRGRVPIGVGTGSGLTSKVLGQRLGAETHLLTANESGLRDHLHRQNMGAQRHRNQDNGHGMSGSPVSAGFNTQGVVGGAQNAINAHNNMQPSLGINYCIKHTA